MRILCLGASYTGRTLARNFPEHEVLFLSRDAAEVKAQGLSAFTPSPDAAGFDLILDTLPAVADPAGNKPARHPYFTVVDELIKAAPDTRLIHISSTSVYPPRPPGAAESGEPPILDERASAIPAEERGRVRLRLEELLLAAWPGLIVIRAAGIYGPGRSLALSFRAGDFRRAGGGNKTVSRIHVHDLCRLILALGSAPEPPALVNAVDRRPTPNAEVFAWLEERLNVSIPGDWREAPRTGRGIGSLYAETLLGGRYRFPTYREGFEHSLSAGSE